VTVVDINDWCKRYTLDVLGLAAFEEDFGALGAGECRLAQLIETVSHHHHHPPLVLLSWFCWG
jgi:hypothetical protein